MSDKIIRATFLDHSGFLLELPSVTLLFDWWKGTLPPLRTDVPLLVLASHSHEDHFNPAVFSLPATAFLLGSDIRRRKLERLGVGAETLEQCRFLQKEETLSPLPGVTVETLPSTDVGVAFIVTADDVTVFHAGDLNWWHWPEETPEKNLNMAANFRRYTEPLRNRPIDIAMLPLDPRLGETGFLGPAVFLELADIRRFIPMHQWGDFSFTERFLGRHPLWREITYPVTATGQVMEFSWNTER